MAVTNPKDARWMMFIESSGVAIPVSMYLLDAWFHDFNSCLALLGGLKSGRPVDLQMIVPDRDPERCRLIHISQHNGRSTFENPLGKPEPIVPLTEETVF